MRERKRKRNSKLFERGKKKGEIRLRVRLNNLDGSTSSMIRLHLRFSYEKKQVMKLDRKRGKLYKKKSSENNMNHKKLEINALKQIIIYKMIGYHRKTFFNMFSPQPLPMRKNS